MRHAGRPGLLHNTFLGPQLRVRCVQRPVWGLPAAFSLPHALLANGLIPREAIPHAQAPPPAAAAGRKPPGTQEFLDNACAPRLWAESRWRRDVAALLDEAAAAGRLDPARLDPARAPSDALIGWQPTSAAARRGEFGLCTDLALTILVLERCAGALYLGARAPERSWERLFVPGLVVDDPRFVARPLPEVLPFRAEAGPQPLPDISLPVTPEGDWSCW
jgi:hypothetical protein